MMKKIYTLIIVMSVCALAAAGQTSENLIYDFRDGSVIENGKSEDGNLTLSGTYSYHSENYGLNMKVDSEIDIAVEEKCTFRFLGSEYSSLNMAGSVVSEGDIGVKSTVVAEDLVDTYDFVYDGEGATVNFKATGDGSDVYLPQIEIVPPKNGANIESAAKNVIYYFDLRDGSIIPNDTDLNGNYTIQQGLFTIECGPENAYGYNGTDHGSILKTGNVITLKVAGTSKIKVAGCQYSGGTVTLSSETGTFDVDSQSLQTTECYKNDGSTVDFTYVGEAGDVSLTYEGTNYVPIIEIVPITYDVQLSPWVQKSGTVALNGVEINYTSGESQSEAPEVTLSEGLVGSTTEEMAFLRMDIEGNTLDSYTPQITGDITDVQISGDTLFVYFNDEGSKPTSYKFIIDDSSVEATAEPGETYSYSFADGTVLPQTGYKSLRYNSFVSEDGILTLGSNTDEESLQFGYHDSSHGAVMFSGNSMDIVVAGNATMTFGTCQYGSAEDAVFQFSDADGTVLGQTDAHNIGTGTCGTNSFTYSGDAGVVTATLISEEHPTAEIYIHGVTIENAAEIISGNGKIDVWDFGAEQFDESEYNNKLNEEIINSWYDASIDVGTSGHTLPNFSAGVLSWVGGGNDRLRTSNTNLTRYDENISGEDYTGRVYVNSGANTGRYLSLTLSENDEVTIVALSQRGGGRMNFQYVGDPDAQTDVAAISSEIKEFKFVARFDGTYHIFDDQDKPSYYRIYRKDADYVDLSGNIDVSDAEGIPEGYAIHFTNEAGKVWEAEMDGHSYSVTIPAGYVYNLSVYSANGFIISNDKQIEVTKESVSHDVEIMKVELYTLTGNITGLGDQIENLNIDFKPDETAGKIFIPEPEIDFEAAAFSVELEPNCEYTILAQGVNDYYMPENTIQIGNADTLSDIAFELKPVYNIVFDTQGLSDIQKEKLGLEFTNLNEDGYVYRFESVENIALRDGVYSVDFFGLDEYPVKLDLTSNLTVNEAEVSKKLTFVPVRHWSFDDKVIESGMEAYNGLLLGGQLKNEVNKGHLAGKEGDVIEVPVSPGDKIRVTYYYSADFSIEGGESYTTSSGSTSSLEYAEYTYQGNENEYVNITIGSGAGTTYITDILVVESVEYTEVLQVGENKDYQTINSALEAVRQMVRENDERVTIAIDPGNYEEMIDIDVPNVTFKNAALTPSIAIQNEGVDIAPGAVRITSYYGHGYHYYSMDDKQRWNTRVLEVNKENGYISNENAGAGTTNGSFWNATVVVSADGFTAEHIIFENSFNQYISKKESEDVVVMWESGSRGERPTDYGNTSVQDKSFVERAAAIAVTNNTDKVVLMNCRVIGRQDSFFGGHNSRVVVYKGVVMGAVDYLFGGMTAVFYQTDLAMNTSDDSSDRSYITAAQQEGGRGYLMYECTVTSAKPGIETSSTYRSKPGYYGRPWQPTTSEVVFYNTTVETTDYSGYEDQSLINPVGWLSTLGGESEMMYEYGTTELSGVDNMNSRATWSGVLVEPVLNDGTDITTYNFTKGDDGWDPIPELIANDDGTNVPVFDSGSLVNVYVNEGNLYVSNVNSTTTIKLFNINGMLMRTVRTNDNMHFNISKGLWIIKVKANDGNKIVKVSSY